MILDFLPNGKIITLNESKNINFLLKLGKIQTDGTTKIKKLSEKVHIIWDENGHSCKNCNKKFNIFYILNENLYDLFCKKCLKGLETLSRQHISLHRDPFL